MSDRFNQRKKDVLSKADKSHKQSWDGKITPLCNKINREKNYYTTSSCSGRIILMIEQEKKAENLFIAVYHDKITLEKLKKDLMVALKQNQNIKFKLEPCILHVSCRSLEDAEKLIEKAKLAGWKKAGIIGTRNSFSVELNGSDRLEFPIIQNGRILVDDEFLKIVAEQANKKLEKSWTKIGKMEKEMK